MSDDVRERVAKWLTDLVLMARSPTGPAGSDYLSTADLVEYAMTSEVLALLDREGEPVAWASPDSLAFFAKYRGMKAKTAICADRTEYDSVPLYARPAPAETSEGEPWKPIETAPKDGTDILACWDVLETVFVIYFEDGAWWDEYGEEYLEPSHWMPLPTPPACTPTGDETEEGR